MRHICFMLAAVFSFFVVPAQKIHFTDSANEWVTLHSSWSEPTSKKIVQSSLHNQPGFIWEDTLAGKVYVKFAQNTYHAADTAAQVLYDYTLQVNDTVSRRVWCSSTTPDTVIHYVERMDTVIMNGQQYKVWHFKPRSHVFECGFFTVPYTVIEGIGCTDGLFFPAVPIYFENSTQLICFSTRSGTHPLSKSIDHFDNAHSCTLSIDDQISRKTGVEIFPNPFHETTTVTFPSAFSGNIECFDGVGRKIFSHALCRQKEFQLRFPGVQQGLYWLRITNTDHKEQSTLKVIAQ